MLNPGIAKAYTEKRVAALAEPGVAVIAHIGDGKGVNKCAAREILAGSDGPSFEPFRVTVEEGAVHALGVPVPGYFHPVEGRIVVEVTIKRLDPAIRDRRGIRSGCLIPLIDDDNRFHILSVLAGQVIPPASHLPEAVSDGEESANKSSKAGWRPWPPNATLVRSRNSA